MRDGLARHFGKIISAKAVVSAIDTKRSTFCLQDVRLCRTNALLADHVWADCFTQGPLEWEMVGMGMDFRARVVRYRHRGELKYGFTKPHIDAIYPVETSDA